MAYLRIALMVASMLAALALWAMLKDSWLYRSDELAVMAIALSLIGLNFVYLVNVRPTGTTVFAGLITRPLRMFRLWLDAKETELRDRSTRSAD